MEKGEESGVAAVDVDPFCDGQGEDHVECGGFGWVGGGNVRVLLRKREGRGASPVGDGKADVPWEPREFVDWFARRVLERELFGSHERTGAK